MKKLTIRETPYVGSSVALVSSSGTTHLLRVTNDGSSKYNAIMLYDEKDEIYEHWDAMYCWEEVVASEPKPPQISKGESFSDYIKAMPSTFTESVLLAEMKIWRKKCVTTKS